MNNTVPASLANGRHKTYIYNGWKLIAFKTIKMNRFSFSSCILLPSVTRPDWTGLLAGPYKSSSFLPRSLCICPSLCLFWPSPAPCHFLRVLSQSPLSPMLSRPPRAFPHSWLYFFFLTLKSAGFEVLLSGFHHWLHHFLAVWFWANE